MNNYIEIFVELGHMLNNFGECDNSRMVIKKAVSENGWFTEKDIVSAINDIRHQMLDRLRIEEWLAPYSTPDTKSCTVGVIMAGNIPLVGFFDMMSVLICGHRCVVKPSSKDSVMLNYIVEQLRAIDKQIPISIVENISSEQLDAVIATGSDNTRRYFTAKYGNIPSLIRGSRASIAVLDGSEDMAVLNLLADDIFRYSGLGCRNVSMVFLPINYNTSLLASHLSAYKQINPKYVNNYLQHVAMLKISGDIFTDGDFFVMRRGDEFPTAISEIAYSFYTDFSQVEQWINSNDNQIQCVVSNCFSHSRGVNIGGAQSPQLTDYPDAVDIVSFLNAL